MNNYIDINNKIWGFDYTESALIPDDEVLIITNTTWPTIPTEQWS